MKKLHICKKNDIEQNLIEDYKRVIKRHISIQEVNSKLSSGKYVTPSQFKNDIDIIWNNLEIFSEKILRLLYAQMLLKMISNWYGFLLQRTKNSFFLIKFLKFL